VGVLELYKDNLEKLVWAATPEKIIEFIKQNIIE
jgi:hypothetical protein